VDLSSLETETIRCGLVRETAESLTSSTNGSIKGWYQHDRILGILFPDLGAHSAQQIEEQAVNTLPASLKEMIPASCVVFRSFPGAGDPPAGEDASLCLFYPDLSKREKTRWFSFFGKRVMDIFGALVGILLFSPFFLVFPLLIKVTSKGPVLFKQERIGRYGEKFVFLKFRTMTVGSDPGIHREYIKKLIREQKSYDADGNNGAVYKIKDDPRVTPVGRWLRKSSLDELPQFFNVLKGEMSLVGPRPPIPYELENYDLWHRRRVMEIKPGITGLWQVEGRSSTNFDDMVRLDLKYAREWTLWLDIKILLKTPLVVLGAKGAY
jgi:lipopolysaccharide/colanic/teichoic acid biosynthesis glycosyltransferase